MIKPTIAVGKDSAGKLSLLYLGDDAAKAIEISRAASGLEIEIYRKPVHYKRFSPTGAVETETISKEVKVSKKKLP